MYDKKKSSKAKFAKKKKKSMRTFKYQNEKHLMFKKKVSFDGKKKYSGIKW